eukprot:COSAG05_NODE_16259_length_350_cov_0.812749_1_plen_46_part_10
MKEAAAFMLLSLGGKTPTAAAIKKVCESVEGGSCDDEAAAAVCAGM